MIRSRPPRRRLLLLLFAFVVITVVTLPLLLTGVARRTGAHGWISIGASATDSQQKLRVASPLQNEESHRHRHDGDSSDDHIAFAAIHQNRVESVPVVQEGDSPALRRMKDVKLQPIADNDGSRRIESTVDSHDLPNPGLSAHSAAAMTADDTARLDGLVRMVLGLPQSALLQQADRRNSGTYSRWMKQPPIRDVAGIYAPDPEASADGRDPCDARVELDVGDARRATWCHPADLAGDAPSEAAASTSSSSTPIMDTIRIQSFARRCRIVAVIAAWISRHAEFRAIDGMASVVDAGGTSGVCALITSMQNAFVVAIPASETELDIMRASRALAAAQHQKDASLSGAGGVASHLLLLFSPGARVDNYVDHHVHLLSLAHMAAGAAPSLLERLRGVSSLTSNDEEGAGQGERRGIDAIFVSVANVSDAVAAGAAALGQLHRIGYMVFCISSARVVAAWNPGLSRSFFESMFAKDAAVVSVLGLTPRAAHFLGRAFFDGRDRRWPWPHEQL